MTNLVKLSSIKGNHMYSQTVLEHFQNPHNQGQISDADGVGNVGNPICGDMMKIYIIIYA